MKSHRFPGRLSPADPFDGVLLVDKPAGPTSHDIVDCVRHCFHIEKVGHGGTLDPMATGLLVILVGKGTKLSNAIMGSDKTYEGTMHLGITTDSQDIDGEVLTRSDPGGVTRERLEAEILKWKGDVMQIPPMVSAVKIDGQPLYKLARKGQTIEREPRLIHVYEFNLLTFAPPRASFRLKCTKGTYVRTLCNDIGAGLGCGAYLESLRRTQAGTFDVANSISLEKLTTLSKAEVEPLIIPLHKLILRELGM